MRLGHVALVVSDLERSLDFYTGLLGLELTERIAYPDDGVGHGVGVSHGAFLRCDETHHRLALFVLRGGDGGPPTGGLHHLAFELPTPEALLDVLARARATGAEVVDERRGGPGNQPRCYVRDPDGHVVELYWGIDVIGPDGAAPPFDPITSIDLASYDFAARAEELGGR